MATKKKGQEAEPSKDAAPRKKDESKVVASKAAKVSQPSSSTAPAKNGESKSKKKETPSQLEESFKQARQFLREVYIEYNKISWPDRTRILQETWSVLFLVAVITCSVLAFDALVQTAIFQHLDHWARMHGGLAGTQPH